MGQDYTLYDWLQLLLLFVGMPFIAATGAALGLLGRIRRGGFLPSTIAGLAGAAIASASLYLGIWTLCLESTINPRVFLEIYDSGYQRYISVACLIATFVVALLWAISWRIRNAPFPPTRILISLRTALFIQVLSLVCVGSWCGLRLLVLQSANSQEMTQRLWQSRGWTYGNGNSLALSGSGLMPEEVKAAMSRENLEDISNYPKITSLIIAGSNLSEVDIVPLASVKNLRDVTFTDCKINASIGKDILQLQQISRIGLEELTTVRPTLTNLARLPKLTAFHAGNVRVQREDFRRFLSSSRLQSIFLNKVSLYQTGNPIDIWPASAKVISIYGCNLTPEDLKAIGKLKSLTDLHLGDALLNDSVLEHFQELNSLQNISFKNMGISARGFEIVIEKIQPPSLHIAGGELPSGVAESLSHMCRLQSLNLTGVILAHQDIEAIANSQAIVELRITSPGHTDRLLLKLASIPSLRLLHYPSFRGCRSFERTFAEERRRRSLQPAQLVVGNTIDANGVTSFVLN